MPNIKSVGKLRVAIVHDYLSEYGGAEKVVNAIYQLFSNADIYTAIKNEQSLNKAGAFVGAKIYAPKLNGLIGKFKKFFIFSYPIYFETLNLSKYDLVITSTAHFAKGVITGPNTLHICYMHTPTRFLWGLKTETSIRDNIILKYPLKLADVFLRIWDFAAAQRPNYILTNSKTTQARIKKFYKRDSTIIYPFFDSTLPKEQIDSTLPKEGDYYFTISRAGKYKNLELIAKTFTELQKNIVIAGSGSLSNELKKYKNSKYVTLLGFINEEEKISYLKGCKAFVLATENEDFGITPIEAQSFGKVVIALNSGGLAETVNKDVGILYNTPNKKELSNAIEEFEKNKIKFDKNKIIANANNYTKQKFKDQFLNFCLQKINDS